MPEVPYSENLLNLFEVETPEGTVHLVCFLEPVMAGARGIGGRSVIGRFIPDEAGEFDPTTFQLNGEFTDALRDYMNNSMLHTDDLKAQARDNPNGWLHLVDPRNRNFDSEPPPADVLGAFLIDAQGIATPGSFRYNPEHAMFDPERGPSGILTDRRFYDWLHSQPEESE